LQRAAFVARESAPVPLLRSLFDDEGSSGCSGTKIVPYHLKANRSQSFLLPSVQLNTNVSAAKKHQFRMLGISRSRFAAAFAPIPGADPYLIRKRFLGFDAMRRCQLVFKNKLHYDTFRSNLRHKPRHAFFQASFPSILFVRTYLNSVSVFFRRRGRCFSGNFGKFVKIGRNLLKQGFGLPGIEGLVT
jgi:hypothetical protein